MKNVRIPSLVVASLIAVSFGACSKQEGTSATPSAPSAGPATVAASPAPEALPRDVVFRQKLACSDAAKSFGFVATSPRGNAYVLGRNCYSATLNTCIVEYTSLDNSATIFDALTGEKLVEFLNFPGTADQINLASRIGVVTPATAATSTAEEGDTPQRVEFLRWSTHLFEACAR